MKRTKFKIKPRKSLKRGKLKKVSKQKVSVLKRKLWAVFGAYIRQRDKYTCFTCGRSYANKEALPFPSAIQAGHFIPKSVGGVVLYFHPDNVHAQCYNCNINLGGNIWEYGKRLGDKKVAELYALKGKIEKWTVEDYKKLIEKYDTRP